MSVNSYYLGIIKNRHTERHTNNPGNTDCLLVTVDMRRIQDHNMTSNVVTARLSVFVGQGIVAEAGFKTVHDSREDRRVFSTCDACHIRVSHSCRVSVPWKRERYDRGSYLIKRGHDYLLVSDLYTKNRRPRNSSRGVDHVLRGAHERNCACAPCLSLTPTHVTERRELFRRSLPLRSCRYGRYVRELHTRRWIRHKTPSESTVTTLRVASV